MCFWSKTVILGWVMMLAICKIDRTKKNGEGKRKMDVNVEIKKVIITPTIIIR